MWKYFEVLCVEVIKIFEVLRTEIIRIFDVLYVEVIRSTGFKTSDSIYYTDKRIVKFLDIRKTV